MLFHIVPEQLEGEWIHPLNTLKEKYPLIHDERIRKYEDRMQVLEIEIPTLNCFWKEVVHLSPVHPSAIRDAFVESKIDWKSMRFFEIPLDRLRSENATFFQEVWEIVDGVPVIKKRFSQFSKEGVNELSSLPNAARHHFRRAAEMNQRPFLFGFVPHVLYRGSIDVTGLSQVEV